MFIAPFNWKTYKYDPDTLLEDWFKHLGLLLGLAQQRGTRLVGETRWILQLQFMWYK